MANTNDWHNQADGFTERVEADLRQADARAVIAGPEGDFERALTPEDYRFLVDFHIDPTHAREKQARLEARQRGNVLRFGACLVQPRRLPEERLIDDIGLRPEVNAWKQRRLREMQRQPRWQPERLVALGVAIGIFTLAVVVVVGYVIARGGF